MRSTPRPNGPWLGCYYSAASIQLAVAHHAVLPPTPWWSSTNPDLHLNHAQYRESTSLANDLTTKYQQVAQRVPRIAPGLLLPWFARMVPGFPVSELAAAEDHELAVSIPQEVLSWTRRFPARGAAIFLLWFTDESLHLAHLGGYSNPARNDTNPQGHLDWAARTPLVTVIRDLVAKTREQYERRQHIDETEFLRYTARTLARTVAWGGIPQSMRTEISDAAPATWESWCSTQYREQGAEWLWTIFDRTIRATALTLIKAERAMPPGPRVLV